jgi:NADH:ubiquinone oxidoreductase subunit 3 (subunit A)
MRGIHIKVNEKQAKSYNNSFIITTLLNSFFYLVINKFDKFFFQSACEKTSVDGFRNRFNGLKYLIPGNDLLYNNSLDNLAPDLINFTVINFDKNSDFGVFYFSDCLKLLELYSLSKLISFFVVFLSAIYIIFFLISGRFFKNIFEFREAAYECGFYTYNVELHNTVALYYFKPLMLFLIFDLEVVYFVPLLFVSKGLILAGFYFVYGITALFFFFYLLVCCVN